MLQQPSPTEVEPALRALRATFADAYEVELHRCSLATVTAEKRRSFPLWKSIQMIERLRADVARGTIVPPETR